MYIHIYIHIYINLYVYKYLHRYITHMLMPINIYIHIYIYANQLPEGHESIARLLHSEPILHQNSATCTSSTLSTTTPSTAIPTTQTTARDDAEPRELSAAKSASSAQCESRREIVLHGLASFLLHGECDGERDDVEKEITPGEREGWYKLPSVVTWFQV